MRGKVVLALLVLAILAAAVVVLTRKPATEPAETSAPPARPPAAAQVATPEAATPAAAKGDTAALAKPVSPDRPMGPQMATVNGQPLYLADIMPQAVEPDGVALSAPRPVYEAQLQAAVERELIRQEAAQRGLALTREQEAKVDEVRRQFEYNAGMRVGDSQPFPAATEAHILQEQDKVAADFLLNAMLQQEGAAAPPITAEAIAAYYASHAAEFEELPADPALQVEAWRNISNTVRMKLISEATIAYEAKKKDFVQALKQKAEITVEH